MGAGVGWAVIEGFLPRESDGANSNETCKGLCNSPADATWAFIGSPRPDDRPRSVSGAVAQALASISPKSAPTPQLRHRRWINTSVRRSWIRPGKFYLIAAANRRIPKLPPCKAWGKFGRKRFLFGPCTARFSFQEKEKWGVHSPAPQDGAPPSAPPGRAALKPTADRLTNRESMVR